MCLALACNVVLVVCRPNVRRTGKVWLSHDQLKPFLSPYLMGGWRTDDLVLERVSVEPCRISAAVRVARYFPPSDGVYHLTVPSAFIWIAQLAIIYGCWEQKLTSKPGEIYVRDIRLKCRSPVTETEIIEFAIVGIASRPVPDGRFYTGNISIDRGSFTGQGRFVLPMPS